MKNLFIIFALFIVLALVCFFGPIRIIEGHGMRGGRMGGVRIGGGHLGRGIGYGGSRFGYGGSRFGYGRGISYFGGGPSYYLSNDDDAYYSEYLYPSYFENQL